MKPPYYKVLWHKCIRCFTHYTSEEPHLRAYLCDDCWKALPHFRAQIPQIKKEKENIMKIINYYSWVIFYFVVGILLLGWSIYNIMVNEIWVEYSQSVQPVSAGVWFTHTKAKNTAQNVKNERLSSATKTFI